MTITGDLREELAKLNPSSIIDLFELETSTAGGVIWQGFTYDPWPVDAQGFEYDGSSTLPRPRIRIANVNGAISAILLAVNAVVPGNDLSGAKVTRIRTAAAFLDDTNFDGANPYGTPMLTEAPREIYFIDRKSGETEDVVEFELASAFDLAGVRLPNRQCNKNQCPWEYRGGDCGYTGNSYFNADDESVGSLADDQCGKRLSSCLLRFGDDEEIPFGGFPGLGQTF
jgi:lambda family phage minor tail protein L